MGKCALACGRQRDVSSGVERFLRPEYGPAQPASPTHPQCVFAPVYRAPARASALLHCEKSVLLPHRADGNPLVQTASSILREIGPGQAGPSQGGGRNMVIAVFLGHFLLYLPGPGRTLVISSTRTLKRLEHDRSNGTDRMDPVGGRHGCTGGPRISESPASRAWRIAPEVSHYRYEEPGVMTNEGTLYGVVGSYTFHDRRGRQTGGARPTDAMTRSPGPRSDSTAGSAPGEVDYDGSYMDGTPLSTSGTDDFLLDVRLLWGREWRPARFFDAVHAGLGYRYLNDDSSAQLGGYERESNYLYVPLGARKDVELTSRWDLALTGEFDVLLIGRQISHLSDVDPGPARRPELAMARIRGGSLRGSSPRRRGTSTSASGRSCGTGGSRNPTCRRMGTTSRRTTPSNTA